MDKDGTYLTRMKKFLNEIIENNIKNLSWDITEGKGYKITKKITKKKNKKYSKWIKKSGWETELELLKFDIFLMLN